jgi:HicB-like antitoxin of HicAB toxin-antitoxin system
LLEHDLVPKIGIHFSGSCSRGESLEEARDMARDAMEGLIEVMLEKGEAVPVSDGAEAAPRFNRLANPD